MIELEQELLALQEVPVSVPSGVARHAWRRARRDRRLACGAALSSVSVLAIGGTVGALGLSQHDGRPSGVISASATGLQSASDVSPSPESSFEARLHAQLNSEDPGLYAVTLPDPAPGFPNRSSHDVSDQIFNNSYLRGPSAPTKIFALAGNPYTTATQPGDPTPGTVTDSATVEVARVGAVGESAVGADAGYPVTGSTVARGCTATVTTEDAPEPQVGVRVTVGGFAIAAYGGTYDPTGKGFDPQHLVPQLVTLIDSLQGIPSGSCG